MKQSSRKDQGKHGSTRCFDLNLPENIITDAPIGESGSRNLMQVGGNDAKLKPNLFLLF
jgi:hypothetical protein